MLSLNEFKKTLCKNGKKYTDDELKLIREMMYSLGEIDYLLFQELKGRNN
jgi:hypothetical protein